MLHFTEARAMVGVAGMLLVSTAATALRAADVPGAEGFASSTRGGPSFMADNSLLLAAAGVVAAVVGLVAYLYWRDWRSHQGYQRYLRRQRANDFSDIVATASPQRETLLRSRRSAAPGKSVEESKLETAQTRF